MLSFFCVSRRKQNYLRKKLKEYFQWQLILESTRKLEKTSLKNRILEYFPTLHCFHPHQQFSPSLYYISIKSMFISESIIFQERRTLLMDQFNVHYHYEDIVNPNYSRFCIRKLSYLLKIIWKPQINTHNVFTVVWRYGQSVDSLSHLIGMSPPKVKKKAIFCLFYWVHIL